jgi:alpha-amylase
MKMKRIISHIFLLVTALFMSCDSNKPSVAKWPYSVNYEVFVLSFADSNEDGKGDLTGLTSRLDYLEDLGIGGIWLMPIMPSPTYHKYDVTDYKGIHPDYGTIDDFKKFVAEAHKRNIKVLVDLILNHTGYEHPWFQSALKGKDSPYRDYYVWADKDSVQNEIEKKETQLDSDNITQWHAPEGDVKAEHYYGYFWGGMPDLNFDNPKVKAEFVDIGKFWLKDMDVDGFRLDAAKHIFPSERAADNHAFWIWFREEMTRIRPDVYLVGEVYTEGAPEEVAPYLRGLPALFNFELGISIIHTLNAGYDTLGLVSKYKAIVDLYNNASKEYIDATFIRNHDQNRTLSELEGDMNKAKLAASIQMTFPGTPYIYYGEEIGMLGVKPDEYIREPFLWDVGHKDKMQTTWEVPKYSTDKMVAPLSKQKNDPESIYNFYKKWIAYRNASRALIYGSIEPSSIKSREVINFYREKDNEKLWVFHNVSDVEVTLPLTELYKIDFTTSKEVKIENNELVLPAYSTAILVK